MGKSGGQANVKNEEYIIKLLNVEHEIHALVTDRKHVLLEIEVKSKSHFRSRLGGLQAQEFSKKEKVIVPFYSCTRINGLKIKHFLTSTMIGFWG